MTFPLPRVGIHAIKNSDPDAVRKHRLGLTLIEPLGGYDVC